MNIRTYFLNYVLLVLVELNIAWTFTPLSSPRSDTVLSANDSPFLAEDDVVVPHGVELSIEAGVTVQFSPKRQLVIEGTIHVNGTDDDFVTLTVYSTNASSEINQTIRLNGGSDEQSGVLQELGSDGVWRTVYDDRIRSLSYYKEWATGLSNVVCRQLGFAVDDQVELYNAGSRYVYVTQYEYDCTGKEPTIHNCTKSLQYTRYGYSVGVRCNSPEGDYWGGINFVGNASSSFLRNVLLDYPGVKTDDEGHSVFSAGIVTSGHNLPMMYDVYVNNSGYDGFQFDVRAESAVISHLYVDNSWRNGFRLALHTKTVVLKTLQAAGCRRNGIDITASLSNERLELSDIEVSDNGDHGISMQTDHSNLDSINSTTEYPKKLFTRDWSSQTTRVFSTEEGEVLALYVLNVPIYSHFVIRDEENVASPVLYTGVYDSNPPPIPWLVTSGRIMSVYIERVYNDNDDVADMIIYSGPPGSVGWYLNRINVRGNDNAGLRFSTTSMPVFLGGITTYDNNIGIELNNVRSNTYVSSSVISNNTQNGINMNNLIGQVKISQCSLNSNSKGIRATDSFSTHRYIHPQSVSTFIEMVDSFANDNGLGLDIFTYISGELLFRNATFARNTKLINLNSDYRGHWSKFSLHDSLVYSNKGEMTLSYESASHIDMTNSHFTQNENQVIHASDLSNRYTNTWVVNENNFTENSGSEYILKFDWVHEKGQQVIVTENRFENNVLIHYNCDHKRELVEKTGILHFNIKQNILFQENSFINSNSKYDVYTATPKQSKYSINASYCYWGTSDQFLVPHRIYGSPYNRNLYEVTIYPYYNTLDRNDVSDRNPTASFTRQNIMGGVLDTTLSLTDTSVEYKVIRNIQILKGGYLYVGPGVNIAFDIGLGVQVEDMGKLDLEGQKGNYVHLYGINEYACGRVRLTDSSTTNMGIVQMLIDHTWQPICYRNFYSSTLNFLCQHMGFYEYKSRDSRELSSIEGLDLVQCSGNSLSECVFAEIASVNCSNGALYLECKMPTWEGLWFSFMSTASTIQHAILSQAGYRYDDARGQTDGSALYFELHRHYVHDIEIINIDDRAKAGIVINYNTLRQPMDDILIAVNSHMDGFVISDYTAILNNFEIYCVQQTNCGARAIEMGAYSSPGVSGIPFCSTNYHYLGPDETLVLRLEVRSMPRYTSCLTEVEVGVGYNIYVKEMNSATISCIDKVQVFDGDLNSTTLANVRYHNKTTTFVWYTDGNIARFLFSYNYYYSYNCADLVLVVVPYQDIGVFPIDEHALQISNSTINGFNEGLFINIGNMEVKLHNSTFRNIGGQSINLNSNNYVLDISNSVFTDVGTGIYGYSAGRCIVNILQINAIRIEQFLRFDYTSGKVIILNSRFFDTTYVFYGQRTYMNELSFQTSEFDGISASVIWTDLYYDTFQIIEFVNNKVNNSARALQFQRSLTHIPNNVTILQNHFEHCTYSVASVYGDYVVFNNNTVQSNNLASGNDLVSMTGGIIAQCMDNVLTSNYARNIFVVGRGFSKIEIHNNVFEDNSYSGNLLQLNVHSYSSAETASIFHNVFGDNTGILDAPLLYFGGVSGATVKYNIFEGYGNSSLFLSPITSLNPELILDFSHNFWNLLTKPEILERITLLGNHIRAQVAPFYNSSQLQNLIHQDATVPIVIEGRIDNNVTFTMNTEVKFEVQSIIAPSVEVKAEEGVVLNLEEHTNLLVYGSVRFEGTSDNPVVIQCREINCRIHIYSNPDQAVSLFEHVKLIGISILQISGTLPLLKNVVMNNTENGIVILGNEAHQKNALDASNVQILSGAGNAFTHLDTKYDISMSSVSIDGVAGKGIAVQPILDGDALTFNGNALFSTFRFCDADRSIKLLPKETLRYFNTDKSTRNCIRIVETEPGYIISVTILTRYFSYQYNNQIIADIFDGPLINASRKLVQIYDVYYARKIVTVRSTRSSIVVRLMVMEKDIEYVVFHSTPVKERDCTFESECEIWQNRETEYSRGVTQWKIYSWSQDDSYGDVLQNDVNLPFSKDGHYWVLRGHPAWSQSYCYSYGRHVIEMNILESSVISPDEHLCSVSFSYFSRSRNVGLRYGQRLRFHVYQKSADSKILIRDLSHSFPSGWSYVSIPLSTQFTENFTIVLLADTYTDCRMSLGVDNIEFRSCSEESDLGTTRITNLDITNTDGQAISIANPDPNKHSLIWLENIDIRQSGLNSAPVVDILLKSGQVLVRNNDISNNRGKALQVQFTSANIDQKSEATISQNNFVNCSSAIHVINTGINNAILTFTQNTVQNMRGDDSSSVFEVINTRVQANDNVFYNNTCRHVLDLGTDSERNTITLPLVFTRNIIWFNTFVYPEMKYSIVVNALEASFTNNVINNPVSQYEVSTPVTEILNATLNFTNNWWGSGVEALMTGKIKDGRIISGLAYVDFLPILSAPPEFLGVQRSVCPFGWTEINNRCYIYKGEARSFNGADIGCREESASLVNGNDIDVEFMATRTLYVDLNGVELYSSVWARSSQKDGTSSAMCNKFTIDGSSLTINEEESDCSDKHPFICKKEPTIRCPNRCFGHGACSYRTCNCYDGWEGVDCSDFHCRDVSDCNGQGTCVGPNQCSCDPGWNGRGCSSSRCPIYVSCGSCSAHEGCGWCDESARCEPGTGLGSDISNCSAWFYYDCTTPDWSTSCSSEIATFSCLRHCDISSSEYNIGFCQNCMDTEKCHRNLSCASWNENMCPSGIPNPDYDDKGRQEQVELFENVVLISPDSRELFACPYDSFSDDASQKEQLLIAETGELYGSGTIIVSDQANGVFHKILKEVDTEGFAFWVATRAKMEEVFKYADFQYSIDLSTLSVDPFEELLPEEKLHQGIISGNVSLTQTVHDFSSDTVYKCIGDLYTDASNTHLTTSQYIVLSTNVNNNINVGDVIVGESSDGFLEYVDKTSQTSFGNFAFTSLTQCSGSSLPSSLNVGGHSNMSCIGSSSKGLEYYTSDNTQTVSVGQNTIGRHSGGFLGLVLSISEQGGYIYVEMIPVEAVENGTAVGEVDISDLTTNRRRKRASLNYQFSKTFSESSGIFTSSLTPSLTIDTNLDVKIHVNWLKYKGFTIVFGGKVVASLVAEITASVEVSKEGPLKKLFSKKLANFAIPVFGAPVPGTVRIELFGQWSMSFGAEGSIRASATNTVTFVSSYASPGYSVPPSNVNNVLERLVTGSIRDVSAKVSYQLTPQLQVQWPSTNISFSFSGNDEVPEPIKKEIGNVELKLEYLEDFDLYLTAILEAPIGVTGLLKACSTDCKDPYKPLYGEVYASVRFGLSLQGFGLKGSISTLPTKIASKSICLSSEFSCCQCLQDDGSYVEGRLDPETEACLCECECEDGTKSLKKEGEECECDKCPDGSLEVFWAEIKCPCECNDKTTKAMEPDGSCDCSCICEDGYTKDIISASGDCPCECKCKNCQPSKIGRQGCDCPDDICPECEDGKQAQWSGCRCECPRSPCGKSPTCASGRTGSNCDQPHCPGGCSGNGVCVKTAGCSSRCRCNRPWGGNQCERIDRRAWGDPHLVTLDGIDFDYFGIGQFWDCKSEANDFGIQVRYFYFKQTSLTGAVAVKAGVSVVTITTGSSAVLGDLPTVRIDGTPVDYSSSSGDYSVRLSEGNVLLNIKKTETTGAADETSVALVSFQFSTVTESTSPSLTLDVRYSPQMNRQYINVQSSITAAFKEKTSGLCGYLDGDTTNDLMGPDGTVHTDTDSFVESWKIDPMHRVGGGLMNSWSWAESNFHEDDLVDITYTDTTFVPSYSIDGFNTAEVDLATQTCEQLNLEDSLLDGCIYDVLITNDTTMANQETLKTGCPNKCSGKGRCQNDTTCICIEGWSGLDCSTGSCGACYNGNCQSGLCHCDVGWEGEECDVEANCDSVDNCTSPNGVCLRTNVCLCTAGFTGDKCDLIATCDGVNECSGNGVCIDFDVCRCEAGWSGNNCSVPTCESLNFCSANGVCVEYDSCACNAGWKGTSCGNPDCTSRSDCSGNGQCSEPNVCDCYNGFTGPSCEQSQSCPMLDDCSGHGVCNVDASTGVLTCRCYTGYSGTTCSDVSCINVNNCNGHGECTDPDVCACDFGYMGADCSELSCEGLSRCNGHGTCISHETCNCNDGWDGDDCSEPKCENVMDCSAQGTCIGPDECQCFDGYEGRNCSEQVGENEHAPMFTSSEYTSSVFSGAVLPVLLVTLEATDDDTGRNGEVTYSIGASGISFDLNQYILIDSETGVVTLVKHIPATSLPSGQLTIAATVTDGGSPSKSDSSTIDLTIDFANDNCPNIVSPKPGASVYINLPISVNETIVQVEATDADVGVNGELVYSIDGADSDKYIIEETSGEIKAKSEITAGTYSLECVVSDKGNPPCKRSMSISAIATAANIPPQTIDIDTTTMPATTETTAQYTEATTMVPVVETIITGSETSPPTVDVTTAKQQNTPESHERTTVSTDDETTVLTTSDASTLKPTYEASLQVSTSVAELEDTTVTEDGQTSFISKQASLDLTTTSDSTVETVKQTATKTTEMSTQVDESSRNSDPTDFELTTEKTTPLTTSVITEVEPFVGSVTMIAITTVLSIMLVVGATITGIVCIKQRNTISRLQKPPSMETRPIRPRFYRPPYFRWN